MKKYLSYLGFLVLIIVATLVVGVMMNCPRLSFIGGQEDAWLGYWGGILGSIIGVVGAVLVLQSQLKAEKESRLEENVDNTFFNLLNLYMSVKSKLEGRESYAEEIKDSLDERYEEWKADSVEKKRKEFFSEKKDIIIKKIEGSSFINIDINTQAYFLEKLKSVDYLVIKEVFVDEDLTYEDLLDVQRSMDPDLETKLFSTDSSSEPLDQQIHEELFSQYREWNKISLQKEVEELITRDVDLLSIRRALKNVKPDLPTKKEKEEIVTEVYGKFYSDYGNYYRIFHRIVKYVNKNVKKEQLKRDYIGFLRAMVSELEMILIYYNSFYTGRGEGLKDELLNTNFFGDPEDFEKDEYYTQHFDKELLLWGEADIEKMKSCKLKV